MDEFEKSKIPLDVLRNVKTIVTHAHCPDGLASAILLHDVLPKAEIIFATHDQLASLPATEGMLFCDIAPPAARVMEFINSNAVVLDHHKTAKHVVDLFAAPGRHTMSCEEDASSRNPCSCNASPGGRGVYADNEAELGVSGAVLAFRHVWCPMVATRYPKGNRPNSGQRIECRDGRVIDNPSPNQLRTELARWFAETIGVRDTFHKSSPDWNASWHLSSAIMFQSRDMWVKMADPFGESSTPFWDEQVEFGEKIETHNRMRADRALDEAFRFITPAKKSVVVVQGLDLTTLLGDMGAADLVVGFQYRSGSDGERFQVSMRSQGVVDVASIAKAHGGGGHTNAAGFTFPCLPVLDPITTIKQILENMGV